mmetsp:Transcript_114903/g.366570  ORF Transcript_114903/g.366570 Transcript_114903/m.366570 type:complete len:208 (-) Transcript_114903:3-626(-)
MEFPHATILTDRHGVIESLTAEEAAHLVGLVLVGGLLLPVLLLHLLELGPGLRVLWFKLQYEVEVTLCLLQFAGAYSGDTSPVERLRVRRVPREDLRGGVYDSGPLLPLEVAEGHVVLDALPSLIGLVQVQAASLQHLQRAGVEALRAEVVGALELAIGLLLDLQDLLQPLLVVACRHVQHVHARRQRVGDVFRHGCPGLLQRVPPP